MCYRNKATYSKTGYGGFLGMSNAFPFQESITNAMIKTGQIPNLTPILPGEKSLLFNNWTGPGTHVKERLAKGDKATCATDYASRTHDISYLNIGEDLKNKKIDKKEAVRRVKDADEKMLKSVSIGKQTDKSLLNRISAPVAETGLKLKNIAEDIGLMDGLNFIGSGKEKNDPALRLRKLAKKSNKVKVGSGMTKQNINTLIPRDTLKELLGTFDKTTLEKILNP